MPITGSAGCVARLPPIQAIPKNIKNLIFYVSEQKQTVIHQYKKIQF
jgi:hypothetical protein